MDENQRKQFRQAVDKKKLEALERRHTEAAAASAAAHEQQLLAHDETPDTYDVRAKSTGHGKKSADKWNQ
jgi:hypothetical protein